MNGLDAHYDSLLAEYQLRLDWQAEQEEARDKLKAWISDLLVENHPAELSRLTGITDTLCKQIVHELYMERFNDPSCWHVERSDNVWVIYGNTTDEWIDENGDYLAFDTEQEANDYIKEQFK